MMIVSIIITCYNLGEYIYEAVNSCLEQTFDNFELIVVDDGSDDIHTIDVINSLAKLNLKLIRIRNKGLPHARNIGISHAVGKYICCLDADDKLHKDYLKRTTEILDHDVNKEIGFVTTWFRAFGEKDAVWDTSEFDPYKLAFSNCVHVTSIFRRECWEIVGGYATNLSGFQDWNFWISIVAKGYKWECLKDPLFCYRVRINSMLTKSNTNKIDLYSQIIENNYEFYQSNIRQILLKAQELYSFEQNERRRLASIVEEMQKNIASDKESRLSIAVCILFYEKIEQTIACVRSFIPSGVRIYILNNNSCAESRKRLINDIASFSNVTLIDSKSNLGVSGGRNRLIQASNEKWLFFVDNDITITTPDWLSKIHKHIEVNSNVDVFVPKVFNVHSNSYLKRLSIVVDSGKARFTEVPTEYLNYFPGGASFVKRTLFEGHGLYDSDIFVGSEDVEYAIRCTLKGTPVKALPIDDIEVCHEHRPVKSKSDRKAVNVRYSEASISKSYHHIHMKYGIDFDDNWREWVCNQKIRMGIRESLISRIIKGLTSLKR